MKKLASVVAVALALSVVSQPAVTAVATGTMLVSLTLSAGCSSVSATPLNFGTATQGTTQTITATSAITVTCSIGTIYTVDLNDGTFGAGLRVLRQGGVGPAYQIYKDSLHTQIWGSALAGGTLLTPTPMSASGSAIHTAFGRVIPSLADPIGIYTDTVTVTVNY